MLATYHFTVTCELYENHVYVTSIEINVWIKILNTNKFLLKNKIHE